MMNTLLQTALPALLILVLPALAAGLLSLLLKAGEFLKSKTSSQNLRDGVDLMVHAASTVVQSLEQTVRPALATLPDGKLTPQAASAIKQQAVAQLMSLAKAGAASGTKQILALGESALNDYLGHLVEAAVAKLPDSTPAPAASAAVPHTPPSVK